MKLASYFKKAAAAQKDVAAQHEAMEKQHRELAALAKSKHDSMDDADVMKAFILKQSETHTAEADNHKKMAVLAKSQEAEAEAQATEAEKEELGKGTPAPASGTPAAAPAAAAPAAGTEAAAAAAPSPASNDGIQKMLDDTTDALVKKALNEINTNPAVQQRIQEVVLEKVNAALAGKLEPSSVRGVAPSTTIVPRAGADESLLKATGVDPELQDMVTIDLG